LRGAHAVLPKSFVHMTLETTSPPVPGRRLSVAPMMDWT
jgi:hypothetical protein